MHHWEGIQQPLRYGTVMHYPIGHTISSIASTSIFVTTMKSGKGRSISLLMSVDGLVTLLEGVCGLCCKASKSFSTTVPAMS